MTIEIEVEDGGSDELAEVVEDALDAIEDVIDDNAEVVEDLVETIEDLAEVVEELADQVADSADDATPADSLIAIGERLAHMENRIDQMEVARMEEIIDDAQPVEDAPEETAIVVPDETPTNWRTRVNDWWFGRS